MGTDAERAHIKFNGMDGLPHARLNIDGKSKPAWQFDDAASAAKAAQTEKH
jgi:hypothetical protein